MSDSDNKKPMTLSLGKKLDSSTVKQSISRGRKKTVTVEVKTIKKNFKLNKPGQEETSREIDSETERKLEILKKAQEEKLRKETEASKIITKSSIEVEESATDKINAMLGEAAPEDKKVKKNKEKTKDKFSKEDTDTDFNDKPIDIESEDLEKIIKIQTESKPVDKETAKKAFEQELETKKKQFSKPKKSSDDEKWNKKKLTISSALNADAGERVRSLASIKRQRDKQRAKQSSASQEFVSKEIIITEFITVQELANRMAIRVQEVIKELMKLGIMKRAVEEIDADTAEIIVSEFNHTPKRVLDSDIENILEEIAVDDNELESRPPIVTVMGHVDHGKTSLLDALRKTNVTEGEAGGITQHIGSYQVKSQSGHRITFIDTPGHAAFTTMRARGANITDIVILVVAADDGVMPQTIEAINHAKAAAVPIIIAINKIDKPDANPDKVKEELLSYDIMVESYGGSVQAIEISAKQKINLEGILDAVLLEAEMLELKASTKQPARGSIVEARVDKGKGVVADAIIQRGTLSIGDIIIAGSASGRVKSLIDDKGNLITHATPSTPVEILGFDEVPAAGTELVVAESEKVVRDIAEYRRKMQLKAKVAAQNNSSGSIDSLFKQAQGGLKEFNIILKGDVHGSVDAIIGNLQKIESDEVRLKIVHNGAGAINESDIQLAMATGSMVIGFNVRAENKAKALADNESVDIRYYNIIYNLIDDVKGVMTGMLSPILREEIIGYANIEQVFKVSKVGKVAGCRVTEGVMKRGAGVRLLRDNVVIHEGKLKTLKRFKDEVPEVKEGYECGMAFENYEDIRPDDKIEAYEVISEQKTLN